MIYFSSAEFDGFLYVHNSVACAHAETGDLYLNGITFLTPRCCFGNIRETINCVFNLNPFFSRYEVYSSKYSKANTETDLNHVVVAGFVKSIYENVDGNYGTHGLVKINILKGPMLFIADGIMTNSEDRFPHKKGKVFTDIC